jgi:ribosomal protein L11 methyltransferase
LQESVRAGKLGVGMEPGFLEGKKERCFLKWAEISIRTSHEATELVAEIFHDLGASGVVIEDPALVNDYIHAGLWDYEDIPEAQDTTVVTVKAYLPTDARLKDKLAALAKQLEALSGVDKGPADIAWHEVQDEDWADNWKQYFHTEKVGSMVVIKPTWEEYEASPDDIVIELDPGAAFGTGTHPTTSMCIRELEELVKGGMQVFDVGTGSGVLAITAAKLGAGRVTATDYDPTAVSVAAQNIQQNQVGDIVQTGVSDIMKQIEGKADLVIANIIADIVIRLFDELKEHLQPDGTLLASGIIAERIPDVTEAALQHGFVIDKVIELKGWAAMLICLGEKA